MVPVGNSIDHWGGHWLLAARESVTLTTKRINRASSRFFGLIGLLLKECQIIYRMGGMGLRRESQEWFWLAAGCLTGRATVHMEGSVG
jgi:hypothetical protein